MKIKFKKKQAKELIQKNVVSTVAKVLYITGLTALIPFLPLLFTPDELLLHAIKTTTIITGVILIAISGFLIHQVYTPKKALRVVGKFTLIPSAIAFLYSIVGGRIIGNIIEKTGPASYYIDRWIVFNVPTAITVAIVYFLIGGALIISSTFWKE